MQDMKLKGFSLFQYFVRLPLATAYSHSRGRYGRVCYTQFLSFSSETGLLSWHSKHGKLEDARNVFNAMKDPSVISWTTIISAYCRHSAFDEVFLLYESMLLSGIAPDQVTFMTLLKACCTILDVEIGKQLHSHIIKYNLENNAFVVSSLVDMYGKCEKVDEAQIVFDNLRFCCEDCDVVLWTTMITCYTRKGLEQEALFLFQQMLTEGVQPNHVTFVTIFKACSNLSALCQGKLFHIYLAYSCFNPDLSLMNALIDMYAKCGRIEEADQAFGRMAERDVISWTTMITGYANTDFVEKAMLFFTRMKQEGLQSDDVAFASIIQVYWKTQFEQVGKQIHVELLNRGMEPDGFVITNLICMYSEFGHIILARKVFNEMPEGSFNAVLWNVMIAGYAQGGNCKEATQLFCDMQEKCVLPDDKTFMGMLKSHPELKQGKCLHVQIRESGYSLDLFLHNALIDMYASSSCLQTAFEIFDTMQDHDVVSWNTILWGHIQLDRFEDALTLFTRMQLEHLNPDHATLSIMLRACTSMTALDYGLLVHHLIIQFGFETDIYLESALIDMYAKCGIVDEAYFIFQKTKEPNIVSCNAMIAGYAQQGLVLNAVKLFWQIQDVEKLRPDHVTFLAVLYAYSHSGIVHEASDYIRLMSESFDQSPKEDHFVCLVDNLSRAGLLNEAFNTIDKMPIQPDSDVWMTLLSACRNHGNPSLGKHAFDQLSMVNAGRTGAYLLLSNLWNVQYECHSLLTESES